MTEYISKPANTKPKFQKWEYMIIENVTPLMDKTLTTLGKEGWGAL